MCFLTVLEMGGLGSGCYMMDFWQEISSWLAGSATSLLCAYKAFPWCVCVERGKASSQVSLLKRAQFSSDQSSTSWPNYLPKAPSPDTVTMGVGASTYEFREIGDTDIQSITHNYFSLMHNVILNPFSILSFLLAVLIYSTNIYRALTVFWAFEQKRPRSLPSWILFQCASVLCLSPRFSFSCLTLLLLQRRSQFWFHIGNCFFHLLFVAFVIIIRASLIAQLVKNLPAIQETLVRFLGREDLLEKG